MAVHHGATRELLNIAEVCAPSDTPRPLFKVQQGNPSLSRIAQQNACPQGQRWHLWLPDAPPKLDALRPVSWIIDRNPDYLDRIVRKGDLRASILQVLRHDTPDGTIASEVALARKCSANRIAIRHALNDLEYEGYPLRQPSAGARNIRIALPPHHRPGSDRHPPINPVPPVSRILLSVGSLLPRVSGNKAYTLTPRI
ncbi:MAG: hypothetical protein HC898_09860 [Phycisphaerales bacterium]|nr:hypothetical protein [Phycisphaerales bacterium]